MINVIFGLISTYFPANVLVYGGTQGPIHRHADCIAIYSFHL